MSLAQELRAALRRFGHHPIECPRWAGRVSCTCGLDVALKSSDEETLMGAVRDFAKHEILCRAYGGAGRCACGLEEVLELKPRPQTSIVKIGPTSVIVEVEETILLPQKPSPPTARVVELSTWRRRFMRGVWSGAIATGLHALIHWWGIW